METQGLCKDIDVTLSRIGLQYRKLQFVSFQNQPNTLRNVVKIPRAIMKKSCDPKDITHPS